MSSTARTESRHVSANSGDAASASAATAYACSALCKMRCAGPASAYAQYQRIRAALTTRAPTGGALAPGELWWWACLAPSVAAGFLVPLPYNYYMLKKYNRSCH